ncbi:MAG TPA: carbon-nitrogen hydrolase family protein [Pseudonocardiaceae bacterium]
MSGLVLTVAELPDEPELLDARWELVVDAVRRHRSDLVLLPELPFASWLCAAPRFDRAAWDAAAASDERWRARLAELGDAAVVSTRPVPDGARRLNQAYVWRAAGGPVPLRAKAHLPHEDGWWERSWFTAVEPVVRTTRVGPLDVGVLICSEMWSFDLARRFRAAGAGLLLVPRASGASWGDRWLAGGRALALVTGAWCASANRSGGEVGFGGGCWVIDPDGGVVARTGAGEPVITVTVDADLADLTGERYPRTVLPEAAEPETAPEGPGAAVAANGAVPAF